MIILADISFLSQLANLNYTYEARIMCTKNVPLILCGPSDLIIRSC